jgi:hypothetical protein
MVGQPLQSIISLATTFEILAFDITSIPLINLVLQYIQITMKFPLQQREHRAQGQKKIDPLNVITKGMLSPFDIFCKESCCDTGHKCKPHQYAGSR